MRSKDLRKKLRLKDYKRRKKLRQKGCKRRNKLRDNKKS
jgi:hypothetical protein